MLESDSEEYSIVNYCSQYNTNKGEYGIDFKFFNKNKVLDNINKPYSFLNCECNNKENNNLESDVSACSHADMLMDDNISKYIL